MPPHFWTRPLMTGPLCQREGRMSKSWRNAKYLTALLNNSCATQGSFFYGFVPVKPLKACSGRARRSNNSPIKIWLDLTLTCAHFRREYWARRQKKGTPTFDLWRLSCIYNTGELNYTFNCRQSLTGHDGFNHASQLTRATSVCDKGLKGMDLRPNFVSVRVRFWKFLYRSCLEVGSQNIRPV